MRKREVLLAIGLIIFMFGATTEVFSQNPTPSVSPTAETVKNAADNAAKTQPPTAPAPDSDLWERETMTGDWGGTRSRWKEKGVELEFKLSNFVQGVASGGVQQDTEYNGKFEMTWNFDLAKVAGWKYWSSKIKAEYRWSGPSLGGTGGVNATNTAVLIPGSNGQIVSITAVNFTRVIPKDLKKGDMDVIAFGRFNMLDLIDEHFFAGGGTERFMNIAQIGPLTVLRQVPLITNGFSYATVRGGEPRFTLAIFDPNDHSLDIGIDKLFDDGVTISPGYNIPTKYWGRTAKHTFGGAVTTKKYTPFDAIQQIVIPGPALNPVEPTRGSWSIDYVFRQYIVERGKKDGWGFFTQVSFADNQRSPIAKFFDLGIGGNGLFKARQRDEFGISYAFTDLSKDLKDNLNLITLGNLRPRPEHQVEMFYNFHITPWFQLTGDLQIIRGVRRDADAAVVPGARLVMIF
jgi:porin